MQFLIRECWTVFCSNCINRKAYVAEKNFQKLISFGLMSWEFCTALLHSFSEFSHIQSPWSLGHVYPRPVCRHSCRYALSLSRSSIFYYPSFPLFEDQAILFFFFFNEAWNSLFVTQKRIVGIYKYENCFETQFLTLLS